MRRSVRRWAIRLGKGSFFLCVEGGWGLPDFTDVQTFDDYNRAERELKKVQKHYPAANLFPL